MKTKNYGVYTAKQLLTGYTKRQIEASVMAGNLRRIMRGWYAGADADPDVVRALKLGGRLGCLSGCAKFWRCSNSFTTDSITRLRLGA